MHYYRKDLVIIIAKLVLKQVVSNGKNVCVYMCLKSVGGRMWTRDKCPEILKAKILKNVVAGFRVFHQV